MRYAVVMAGGSGKRLWPMSRRSYPKQLLRLTGDKSLLELAMRRLEGLFEPENSYVITNVEYAAAVRQQLAFIPAANVIEEPEGRDTCNAIALTAEILAGKDERGTMAVFTADHIIRPEDAFRRVVARSMEAAEADPKALLTFGIRPSWPHTGLGYLRRGDEIADGVFTVRSFHEKPDHATARKFLGSGEYFWNSGMFTWTLDAIRGAVRKYVPETAQALEVVSAAVSRGEEYMPIVRDVYPGLEKKSIDYAVMEKSEEVAMTELGCEWIDLGSWGAMEDVLESDKDENVIRARQNKVMDSRHNVIVSSDDDHLIAVAGLEDCVVVHTPDVTLVCNRSAAERLKDIVDSVDDTFGGRYT